MLKGRMLLVLLATPFLLAIPFLLMTPLIGLPIRIGSPGWGAESSVIPRAELWQ